MTPSALWLWTSPTARFALQTGDLGAMVKAWRLATGTSQHSLAEQLGYDSSYISMIETGRRDVADVVSRRRIAQHLGIPLHHVGLTDPGAADHAAMLQFGHSTVRLAIVARQRGDGGAAVNELWPLVARLEARAEEGLVDRGLLLLLARARAELGVSLGYVLPEERLVVAVRWTGRALRLAQHLDDTDLHAYSLRVHGNELRKAERTSAAFARLTHAAAIASEAQRPAILAQLARATSEPEMFDRIMEALAHALDAHRGAEPVVSDTALREVRLRGLLATGRIDAAIEMLGQQHVLTERTSPQWKIIEQITVAEVLLAAGDVATAEAALTVAIAEAERHRLPHQIQRAARTSEGRSALATQAASASLARILDQSQSQAPRA